MQKTRRPKELPEWFTISIPKASFSAKDVANLFNCNTTTARKLMKYKETCQTSSITHGKGNATILWRKSIVLEVWNSLEVADVR